MPKERTPKMNEEHQQLARRYEMAWYKLFYDAPHWKQKVIIEEPHDRIANDLARETRKLAESNRVIEVVGKAKEYLEASGKLY